MPAIQPQTPVQNLAAILRESPVVILAEILAKSQVESFVRPLMASLKEAEVKPSSVKRLTVRSTYKGELVKKIEGVLNGILSEDQVKALANERTAFLAGHLAKTTLSRGARSAGSSSSSGRRMKRLLDSLSEALTRALWENLDAEQCNVLMNEMTMAMRDVLMGLKIMWEGVHEHVEEVLRNMTEKAGNVMRRLEKEAGNLKDEAKSFVQKLLDMLGRALKSKSNGLDHLLYIGALCCTCCTLGLDGGMLLIVVKTVA